MKIKSRRDGIKSQGCQDVETSLFKAFPRTISSNEKIQLFHSQAVNFLLYQLVNGEFYTVIALLLFFYTLLCLKTSAEEFIVDFQFSPRITQIWEKKFFSINSIN